MNFFVFRAVLPPEAVVGECVELGHFALNVVIHPNVSIGDRVRIWHGVTLAVSDSPGSPNRIVIESDVTIGTGAVIISPYKQGLTIGAGAVIGANSVVTADVAGGVVAAGAPAREIHQLFEGKSARYR